VIGGRQIASIYLAIKQPNRHCLLSNKLLPNGIAYLALRERQIAVAYLAIKERQIAIVFLAIK
jgi:hypothetical protein